MTSRRPHDRTPTLVVLGRAFGLHGNIEPLFAPTPRPSRARVPWRDDVAALGIPGFLSQCDMIGDPVPDPGHPVGLAIALWLPPRRYGRDLVLDCHNGTRDQDTGLYERVLLRVPATCRTPVDAAASTYGVNADEYLALARRT